MGYLTEKVVFSKLEEFLGIIIGADAMELIEVSLDSKFVSDLELDSIQIVAFSEMVKKEYKIEAQFVKWFSRKTMKQMFNLTVGDVVNFIVKKS